VILDVARRGNANAIPFTHRDRGAVESYTISRALQWACPAFQVLVIVGWQAPTFLDVEKNYSSFRESFLCCQVRSALRVHCAFPTRGGNIFQRAAFWPIKQNYKSKTLLRKQCALADLGAFFLAWRRADPVTRK
jgi:hypothetical protein